MWYDDHASIYGESVRKINQYYCDRHGYKLIFSNKRNHSERNPHWERIPLVLSVIDSFDYTVWIDADALFHLEAPRLESMIEKYGKDLLFNEDIEESGKGIASGFFIAKNTEKVRSILNYWCYSKDIYERRNKKWQDQSAIRLMYEENILDCKSTIGLIPYGELQNYSGTINKGLPYVWHMAGINNEQREKHSKSYLLKLLELKRKSLNGVQLTEVALSEITSSTLHKKTLIYGLGNDSKYWDSVCIATFIEENPLWAEKSGIDRDKIILYNYKDITVENSFYKTDTELSSYPLPTQEKYDVIVIDAPTGYNNQCPGRLLPIYWAKQMLNKGGIIYVDDCNRPLEKYAIEKYFKDNKKEYFNERTGLIKIYG